LAVPDRPTVENWFVKNSFLRFRKQLKNAKVQIRLLGFLLVVQFNADNKAPYVVFCRLMHHAIIYGKRRDRENVVYRNFLCRNFVSGLLCTQKPFKNL